MSLAATKLQDLRVNYQGRFDAANLQNPAYGLLEMARDMSEGQNSIITQEIQRQADLSNGADIQTSVLKRGNVTINNVRSCTIQCSDNESDLVTISFKTISADICMKPVVYINNEIGYNQDLIKKLSDVANAFSREISDDIETTLDANKSQVYNSSIVSDRYTLDGNIIQVPAAQRSSFYGDMAFINFADNFTSTPIYVAGNDGVGAEVARIQREAGEGDARNQAVTLNQKRFYYDMSITNRAAAFGTGYFMPENAFGLLTTIPVVHQTGFVGQNKEWTSGLLPDFPFRVAFLYENSCADLSSEVDNATAEPIEKWQISLDYATVTQYNQDPTTQPGVIRKFEILQ